MKGFYAGVPCKGRGSMQGNDAGFLMQGFYAGVPCKGSMDGNDAGVSMQGTAQGYDEGVSMQGNKYTRVTMKEFYAG